MKIELQALVTKCTRNDPQWPGEEVRCMVRVQAMPIGPPPWLQTREIEMPVSREQYDEALESMRMRGLLRITIEAVEQ